MIRVDAASSEAPFEQVRRQVAEQVADGRLSAGTRMPTVRALAEQLGLAVNTVAKAYKALEADGVIETQGRRGTFVSSAVLSEGTDEAARAYVLDARRRGLSREEAVRLVERHWGARA